LGGTRTRPQALFGEYAKMIYRTLPLVALVGVLLFSVSCEKQTAGDSKPIAKVNDYVITEDNFRVRLLSSMHMADKGALSFEDKKRFLEEEIGRELLVQEAMKLDLDKDASFRYAIEKYWEQTLITELLKRKAESLQDQSLVTEEEIKARYEKMAKSEANPPPLKEAAASLEKEIREEKKAKALQSWLDEIRQKASITINEENLRALH